MDGIFDIIIIPMRDIPKYVKNDDDLLRWLKYYLNTVCIEYYEQRLYLVVSYKLEVLAVEY